MSSSTPRDYARNLASADALAATHNGDEAAALLDAYLERADTRARLAALRGPLIPASV